ncbi:MAG: TetR/AcrR family transcriptional regulator [Clostridiales bacterium]|nr:TetR/AcrR family transcriptional regulator [Clostridiales bacterium]
MNDNINREKPRRDRREDILKAALETFGNKGIFHSRIEEVATAAGIGKGTVYEYFRSKEELISAAIRYEMDELGNLVKAKADLEDTVKDKLKAIVEAIILYHQKNRSGKLDLTPAGMGGDMKEFKDLAVEQNARWQGWLEEIIREGAAKGEIRFVDPQIFYGALMGAVMGMVRPWSEQPAGGCVPEEAAEQVAAFFFAGIEKRG